MGLNEIIQIGARLKQIRKEKGWTQKNFAEYVKIPYSTYSNYENGNRVPSKEQLEKIVAALGITIPELLGMSESEYIKYNKTELNKTTLFLDYLELLGYKITSGEYTDYTMYIESSGKTIDINSPDLELLESSVKGTITTTIKWLLDTQNRQ